MEILSPAGSFSALRAAVFAGADAVYFGAETFNARENASNFSESEISEAVLFCRERGVACHAVLNVLIKDKEFADVEKIVGMFVRAGVDAFIVQDLALADYIIKNTNIPVHASTQLTVHSLDGATELFERGFKRIVLSRELSKYDISYIVRNLPDGAETEVFVHGALCMCYSGQCYMSSVIGKRSGNRGLCAQPCRLPYREGYTLSLKDLSLLRYVKELENIGVTSLKIEGRMKSPEYVYAVTKEYAAAKSGIPFSKENEEKLASVFSRNGFTQGYYEDRVGKEMFGTKSERSEKITFEEKETKRFGVDISVAESGGNVCVTFLSTDGFAAETEIAASPAENAPTTKEQLERSLSKFGNTFYYMKSFSGKIPDGIFIPVSDMNGARRRLCESLGKQRVFRNGYLKDVPFLPEKSAYHAEKTRLRGYFLYPENLPENAGILEKIWLPLMKFSEKATENAVRKYKDKIGFFLPRIFHDSEKNKVLPLIKEALDGGISDFLVGNVGQIRLLKDLSLSAEKEIHIHGDFGLNVFNSVTNRLLLSGGLSSTVASFELPFAAIKDFSGENTGIIAYGRLPFMIMRNCVKKQCKKPETLVDRRGKKMLLTCDLSCRNSLWNADILWTADKDTSFAGFSELLFTDEDKKTAEEVINAYINKKPPVGEITRGLY